MKDLIENTISKIKSEHIKPEARWKFLIKKYGTWLAFALAVMLAAFSFGAGLNAVGQLDWDLYRYASNGPWFYLLSLVPYLWIILLAMLVTFAFIDFRSTQSGYKFSWLKVLLFSLGTSLIVGVLVFVSGLGSRFENMASSMPMYANHMMTKQTQWMQPHSGFLAGTLSSENADSFQLNDLNGKKWAITKSAGILIRPMVSMTKGEMIKIIGKQISSDQFEAQEIRPWMGQGMMSGQGPARGMGPGMMR